MATALGWKQVMVHVLMELERSFALYQVDQMMSGWNQALRCRRRRKGGGSCL